MFCFFFFVRLVCCTWHINIYRSSTLKTAFVFSCFVRAEHLPLPHSTHTSVNMHTALRTPRLPPFIFAASLHLIGRRAGRRASFGGVNLFDLVPGEIAGELGGTTARVIRRPLAPKPGRVARHPPPPPAPIDARWWCDLT